MWRPACARPSTARWWLVARGVAHFWRAATSSRLLDVFFKEQSLFLVFEYLNGDLKQLMDSYGRSRASKLAPRLRVRFRCTVRAKIVKV